MMRAIHGLAIRMGAWLDDDADQRMVLFRSGCFAAALRSATLADAYLTVDDLDDDPSMRLASVRAGTLRFWEEADGLMFEATLADFHAGEWTQAALVYNLVRVGAISGCCLGHLALGDHPSGSRLEVHEMPSIAGLKLTLFTEPASPGTWVRVGVAPTRPQRSEAARSLPQNTTHRYVVEQPDAPMIVQRISEDVGT